MTSQQLGEKKKKKERFRIELKKKRKTSEHIRKGGNRRIEGFPEVVFPLPSEKRSRKRKGGN